jgi:hypothetical protein
MLFSVLRQNILNYFLFMHPDIRNKIGFFKVPNLRPLVLMIGADGGDFRALVE